jgi:hypothetical protein
MIFDKVKSILRNNKYVLYTRPYELNIVGMRSGKTISNVFNDEIHVFYRVSGLKWNYHVFKATTDPGTFWLNNPMSPQGTAIMAQGQYVDCYEIGLHKGEYDALIQKAPVTVLRDYDRTAYLDFLNGNKDTGLFGIDIHRAKATGSTLYVDEYSAGCQVFQNADDFAFFMTLCETHRQMYGNSFSYTLIDYRALRREVIRRLLIAISTLGLGLFTWYELDE